MSNSSNSSDQVLHDSHSDCLFRFDNPVSEKNDCRTIGCIVLSQIYLVACVFTSKLDVYSGCISLKCLTLFGYSALCTHNINSRIEGLTYNVRHQGFALHVYVPVASDVNLRFTFSTNTFVCHEITRANDKQ